MVRDLFPLRTVFFQEETIKEVTSLSFDQFPGKLVLLPGRQAPSPIRACKSGIFIWDHLQGEGWLGFRGVITVASTAFAFLLTYPWETAWDPAHVNRVFPLPRLATAALSSREQGRWLCFPHHFIPLYVPGSSWTIRCVNANHARTDEDSWPERGDDFPEATQLPSSGPGSQTQISGLWVQNL